jgi:3-hydroxybutyryl-CoA dehydrogenase
MGLLFLTDYVGLDTMYYISEIMFDEFKEPRFGAAALKRMVLAGLRLEDRSGFLRLELELASDAPG